MMGLTDGLLILGSLAAVIIGIVLFCVEAMDK